MRFDISKLLPVKSAQPLPEQKELRKEDRTLLDIIREREEKKKVFKKKRAEAKRPLKPLLIIMRCAAGHSPSGSAEKEQGKDS